MATGFSNMSGILKKVSMASISPKRMTLVMLIALTVLGGMGWIMISGTVRIKLIFHEKFYFLRKHDGIFFTILLELTVDIAVNTKRYLPL